MDGKKLVIYCKRGLLSVDIAERLRDMGYDAYSLKGGYIEWLMREIQKREADELKAGVEASIMKNSAARRGVASPRR